MSVHIVSTRRVDELVGALGRQGISKSQVSRLYEKIDAELQCFRNRRLEGLHPLVWLDVTFVKVREQGRVVSAAVVIAIGVKDSGECEVLGLDVGPSKDGQFWLQFLCSLVARGLAGVQLVISDSHQGAKECYRCRAPGRKLAKVSSSFSAQCARFGSEIGWPNGRRHDPHRVRAAPMRPVLAKPGARLLTASQAGSRAWPMCLMKPNPMSWLTWPIRPHTGGRFGPTPLVP